jgi:hypothetical protein
MFVSRMKDGRVFIRGSGSKSGTDGSKDTVLLSYMFGYVVVCIL